MRLTSIITGYGSLMCSSFDWILAGWLRLQIVIDRQSQALVNVERKNSR
jgi:hypothetical protein